MRADEAVRLRRVGQYEHDNLGARQQAVEFADGVHFRLGARGAGHAQHLDMKRREHALDLLADGSVTNHEHCLAGEFLKHDGRIKRARVAGDGHVARAGIEAALPNAGSLHFEIEREIFEHGENGAHRPLRGGDIMRALGIADGDMGADDGGNPLCAGHHREHQPDAAQVWPGLYSPYGVGVRNPDIDFDIVIRFVGQRDEFDFLREILQQISGINGWVSNS